MNTKEIIEMAKQAGLAHFYDSEGHCTGITDAELIIAEKERDDERLVEMLMPFAKLVAQHERERIFGELLKMHEIASSRHNYYLNAVLTIKARGQA